MNETDERLRDEEDAAPALPTGAPSGNGAATGMRGSSPAHGRDIVARSSAEVIGTSVVERTGADEALELEQELMTVNLGPHHPATHGVLRLLVSLQGETVIDLKPIMGYVHTGIEKNCEDKSYWKAIPFVERMDYLSYFFNMQAFCGCVEKMLDLEIPPRAKYLRVIHMELNRLHSHLVWLGTSALDLGAMSMFFYCFRDRDRILDLFEMSTGQRMHRSTGAPTSHVCARRSSTCS